MAMTKAEKAHVEALKKELREVRALRWTSPVEADIPIPKSGEASGYAIVGSERYARVEQAWSQVVVHGTGYPTREAQRKSGASGRQQGIPLFSSRLLALRALRHKIERTAANQLAYIDEMIEGELAQLRDNEPATSGRHCPLDGGEE